MKQYNRFIIFAKGNLFFLSLCFVLNLLSGLSKSAGAVYIQLITDGLVKKSPLHLTFYIMIGGLLTFAAYVLRWSGAVVPRYLMEKFACETRISLLEHLQKIPFLTYEGMPLGDLQSLIQNDSVRASQIFYTVFSRIVNNSFLFLFSVWAMARTNGRATLVTVMIVISATIINQLILRRMKKYEKAAQYALGAMTQSLEGTYRGMETVKTYWAKNFVQSDYLHKQQEYCDNKLKSARVNAIRALWYTFIENLCLYGSIAYLGYMGIRGTMSVGEVVMFIYLIKQIIMPIEVVFRWMSTLAMSSASWERIMNRFCIPDTGTEPDRSMLPAQVDNVTVADLTFSYGNLPPILNHLNLHFERGKITGLFGTSGTGKTTLLKVIAGLYHDAGADYSVNGTAVNTIQPYVTYASLEKSIFPMSVYDNIALGNERVTSEDVRKVLAELGFENWISSLPEGISTVVKTEDMSGGQKQAISTARALLCHKQIVILDEPFSALDSEKEKCLTAVLKKEKQNRIIIITSHRCDKSNLFDCEIVL